MGITTAPISEGAQLALARYLREHREEITEILAPFDLSASDIELPQFRRIVRGPDFLAEVAAIPASGSTRAPLPAGDGLESS